MAINALPTPPSTSDPANFSPRADAWNLAIVTTTSQINSTATQVSADAATAAAAAAAAAALATCFATSTSSNSIGTGDKTFTVASGLGFVPGTYVLIANTAAPGTNYMLGAVKTYSSTTLVVTVDAVAGSGTYTAWTISPASRNGLPAADTATIRAGTSTATALTPGGEYNAMAEVTLTDAATVTPDFAAGQNFILTTTSGVGSTRQIANPSNPKVGQTGRIRVVQDATGSRAVTFGSNWKRAGGATTMTTTPNATDVIEYEVITSTFILYDVIKNPS